MTWSVPSRSCAGSTKARRAFSRAPPHRAHVAVGGLAAAFGLARLDPVLFCARGVAPLGYAAFTLALGVTAGVLLRRTLPAMAVTLAAFVVIQVVVPNLVRPHLLPPAHVTAPLKLRKASIDLNAGRWPLTGRRVVCLRGSGPGGAVRGLGLRWV